MLQPVTRFSRVKGRKERHGTCSFCEKSSNLDWECHAGLAKADDRDWSSIRSLQAGLGVNIWIGYCASIPIISKTHFLSAKQWLRNWSSVKYCWKWSDHAEALLKYATFSLSVILVLWTICPSVDHPSQSKALLYELVGKQNGDDFMCGRELLTSCLSVS